MRWIAKMDADLDERECKELRRNPHLDSLSFKQLKRLTDVWQMCTYWWRDIFRSLRQVEGVCCQIGHYFQQSSVRAQSASFDCKFKKLVTIAGSVYGVHTVPVVVELVKVGSNSLPTFQAIKRLVWLVLSVWLWLWETKRVTQGTNGPVSPVVSWIPRWQYNETHSCLTHTNNGPLIHTVCDKNWLFFFFLFHPLPYFDFWEWQTGNVSLFKSTHNAAGCQMLHTLFPGALMSCSVQREAWDWSNVVPGEQVMRWMDR